MFPSVAFFTRSILSCRSSAVLFMFSYFPFSMVLSIICCLLCPLPLFPSLRSAINNNSTTQVRSTCAFAGELTSWFVTFCFRLIFNVFIQIHVSNASIFFRWFCVMVYVSAPYSFHNSLPELQVYFAYRKVFLWHETIFSMAVLLLFAVYSVIILFR